MWLPPSQWTSMVRYNTKGWEMWERTRGKRREKGVLYLTIDVHCAYEHSCWLLWNIAGKVFRPPLPLLSSPLIPLFSSPLLFPPLSSYPFMDTYVQLFGICHCPANVAFGSSGILQVQFLWNIAITVTRTVPIKDSIISTNFKKQKTQNQKTKTKQNKIINLIKIK